MRKVICHYHIYKNSGTSFDKLLANNFADKHLCFDGPFPFFNVDQEQLAKIIVRKKEVIAFSSHQIRLPVPISLEFAVLPVIFLRHPLLRIQSIYRFKRQAYDGTLTSKNAQEMDFEDWVTYCLSDRGEIVHISNAQTSFLGAAYRQRPLMRRTASGMEHDLCQAIRNIKNVDLIARTEYFDRDVKRFPDELKKHGIDFEFMKIIPQNTTTQSHELPLSDRIEQVRKSLSRKIYEKLLDANAQDIYLFEYVSKIIEG